MKRNIIMMVLLIFVTFGFYSLYWLYKVSKEINELTNNQQNNPLLDLILTIFTMGFYSIYWFYKIGKQIEEYEEILCMKKTSIKVITPILAFFMYPWIIISMGLVQHEINKICDEKMSF